MPVQFIGYVGFNPGSEANAPTGPLLDVNHVQNIAKVHEAGGFDRALVAFNSPPPA
jgi:alkanesulfonate monooxygenase